MHSGCVPQPTMLCRLCSTGGSVASCNVCLAGRLQSHLLQDALLTAVPLVIALNSLSCGQSQSAAHVGQDRCSVKFVQARLPQHCTAGKWSFCPLSRLNNAQGAESNPQVDLTCLHLHRVRTPAASLTEAAWRPKLTSLADALTPSSNVNATLVSLILSTDACALEGLWCALPTSVAFLRTYL